MSLLYSYVELTLFKFIFATQISRKEIRELILYFLYLSRNFFFKPQVTRSCLKKVCSINVGAPSWCDWYISRLHYVPLTPPPGSRPQPPPLLHQNLCNWVLRGYLMSVFPR